MTKTPNTIKLAYVIPTKDRPGHLRVLFSSLQKQTILPHQIIVVDGSDPDIKYVCDEYPQLPITYVRCYPPSLAKQRNAGMKSLDHIITHAGYLDDDLELNTDATEKMISFWETADSNIGGAAFSIRNQPPEYHTFFRRVFKLTGQSYGKMLPSGFAVYIPGLSKSIKTDWLYGGATIWSRKVIKSFKYDEWYSGHGYLEDVDFSFRVGLKYQLYVLGDSKCLHHSARLDDGQQYVFGKQQIYNRIYFIRKMKVFSTPYVFWAIFGNILMNLMAMVRNLDKPHWNRVRGNFVGLFLALKGDKTRIHGFWK